MCIILVYNLAPYWNSELHAGRISMITVYAVITVVGVGFFLFLLLWQLSHKGCLKKILVSLLSITRPTLRIIVVIYCMIIQDFPFSLVLVSIALEGLLGISLTLRCGLSKAVTATKLLLTFNFVHFLPAVPQTSGKLLCPEQIIHSQCFLPWSEFYFSTSSHIDQQHLTVCLEILKTFVMTLPESKAKQTGSTSFKLWEQGSSFFESKEAKSIYDPM